MRPAGLAFDGAVAAATSGGRTWRLTSASVPEMITELRAAIPARTRIEVVLLSPLVQTRFVALPPLAPRHTCAVIRRDIARMFPSVPPDPVVAADRGPDGRVLVALTSDAVLSAVESAILRAGLRPGGIRPAIEVWEAAAQRKSAADATTVIVDGAQAVEVWTLRHGRCADVRRFPEGIVSTHLLTLPVPRAQDTMVLLCDPGRESAFDAALKVAAVESKGSPLELASQDIVQRSRLALKSSMRNARTRERGKRFGWAAALVTVALLGLGAAAEWWGTARELAAVREERAKLAADVAVALDVRDELDHWSARLDVLADHQRMQSRSLLVLAQLTENLPDGAFLSSLRATPESIAVSGSATRARDAFHGLDQMAIVAGWRSLAPIGRQPAGSGGDRETFLLAGALRPLDDSTRAIP